MSIPLADPESIVSDVVQITTVRVTDDLRFPANSVEGTGFVLADGLLVTCWHCVAAQPPERCFYGAAKGIGGGKTWVSPIGGIERVGNADLAVGRINFGGELGLRISDKLPTLGAPVWTFGYPLTQQVTLPGGTRFFKSHPRLLKGHITRRFVHEHPELGNVPSWELSFAAPEGLSGAPLFLDGTLDVVGVIYGNNDAAVIDEFASYDPTTGKREPEIQRIVSFGLAHYLTTLEPIQQRVARQPDIPEGAA